MEEGRKWVYFGSKMRFCGEMVAYREHNTNYQQVEEICSRAEHISYLTMRDRAESLRAVGEILGFQYTRTWFHFRKVSFQLPFHSKIANSSNEPTPGIYSGGLLLIIT